MQSILPSDWFTSPLLTAQADQRVLLQLVKRFMPDIAAHLQSVDVDLTMITFGWFLSLFTDSLHIHTLLRVWDLVFALGASVLFRVALALIHINAAEILACGNTSDMYGILRSLTGNSWQADKLMRVVGDDTKFKFKEREVDALRHEQVRLLKVEFGIEDEEE